MHLVKLWFWCVCVCVCQCRCRSYGDLHCPGPGAAAAGLQGHGGHLRLRVRPAAPPLTHGADGGKSHTAGAPPPPPNSHHVSPLPRDWVLQPSLCGSGSRFSTCSELGCDSSVTFLSADKVSETVSPPFSSNVYLVLT